MRRRILTTVVMAIGLIFVLVLPAFAGDCYNASRPANGASPGDVKGHWIYLDGFGWAFIAPGTFGTPGSFQGGDDPHGALLDGSAACDNPNRQTEHGIQRAGHSSC